MIFYAVAQTAEPVYQTSRRKTYLVKCGSSSAGYSDLDLTENMSEQPYQLLRYIISYSIPHSFSWRTSYDNLNLRTNSAIVATK